MNWRWAFGLMLLGLLGGAAGFAWLSSEGSLPLGETKTALATAEPAKEILAPAPAFATPTIIQPSASQAEAMLLVAKVRDTVQDGKPLGDLGSRLQATFGQTQPQALAAIANGARQPVSNAALLAGFDAIAPKLSPPNGTAWDRIQYEMRTLFILRSGQAAMTAGAARIERIRAMIVAGDIEEAAKAVRAMPGAALAADWLASANRAIALQRALDALDQAAAIPPAPVLLPSPATEPVEPLVPAIE